ncbi:uncharacterized protein LOC126326035 [Schistocerca gregaria]|uniref:uncharacterized protein LOC126326035 n=1 Tax=Schistocerca gregaria TaxID=7010 RepID=UPI00211E442E|nr:uncharacterized protein LOC126326035 [Schistocerca gregaria]
MIKLSIKKETTMTIFLLYKFEFALLTLSICLFAKKYLIILYDLYRFHGQWEEKNVLIMLLELFGDFCRMLLNIFLFVSMVNSIGLPLHLTRQFAESIMLFRKRLIEFVRYRKATKNMNQRFPNATPEQIAQVNHICVICRETMTQGKILQCGHILHLKCLREWLEHQQSCPTCRLPVLETNQETRNDSSNVATRSPPSSPLDTPPPSEQSLFFPASVSNPPMPAIPVQEGPADRQDAAIQDPSGSRPFSLSWDSNLTQQGQPIQYASVPFVQVPFSSQLPQLPQGAVFLSGVQSSTEASSRIEHMLSSIERRIDSLQQQVQEIRQIVSQRT